MPFGIRIDIGNKHDAAILARLDRLERKIDLLVSRSQIIMAVSENVVELQGVVGAVAAGIPGIRGAIDALEAAVTAGNTGMSQEDKDAIAQAVTDLRGAVAGMAEAVADATDGVDEAAPAP